MAELNLDKCFSHTKNMILRTDFAFPSIRLVAWLNYTKIRIAVKGDFMGWRLKVI